METRSQLAWWFACADKRLPNGDGRRVRKGVTHKHKGPLILCNSGLHASVDIMDALKYARSGIICRVRCGGEIVHGHDKLVCSERTYLHVVNIERELHEFSIWCAARALKRAKVTDERCWNALKVKRLWLDGRATDQELSAARSASSAAYWAACSANRAACSANRAACSAACSAARSANWAACSAACSAARSANWAAYSAADWAAHRAKERKAQSRKFTSMVNAKIRGETGE